MKVLMLGSQKKYRGSGKGYSTIWNEEFFREELARRVDINFSGWGYDPEWSGNRNISEMIERFGKPDVIINHYHRENYKGLGNVKNILKVWIAGDFYDENWRFSSYLKHAKINNYDISCGYSPYIVGHLKKYNVGEKQYTLTWGVDTYVHRDLKIPRIIDVSAIYSPVSRRGGSHVYPLRSKIHEMLRNMSDINTYTENTFFDDYVLKLNQSKISVNDNSYFKFVNPRATEVMSCGTLYLTDGNSDFKELGYENGKHLVFYDGIDDLKEKIFYYLDHEEERKEIAENGRVFVRENYSNRCRAERLLSIIKENL